MHLICWLLDVDVTLLLELFYLQAMLYSMFLFACLFAMLYSTFLFACLFAMLSRMFLFASHVV